MCFKQSNFGKIKLSGGDLRSIREENGNGRLKTYTFWIGTLIENIT